MIFEIDNIELEFDGKQILTGIYIKAETGKITGILGANGTGKSCLMKIFFGSLHPLHKLIRIDNRAFLPPLFTSGMVKYLPQHFIIPSGFKISKAFEAYRVDWNEFVKRFPGFGIYKDVKIKHLSSGEKRVLEIYLVLKSDAKLVLLDEPFTHLAPVYIETIKSILQEEKATKGIVLTDQMYRHTIDVADELYLLKNCCTKKINALTELEDHHFLNPTTM